MSSLTETVCVIAASTVVPIQRLFLWFWMCIVRFIFSGRLKISNARAGKHRYGHNVDNNGGKLSWVLNQYPGFYRWKLSRTVFVAASMFDVQCSSAPMSFRMPCRIVSDFSSAASHTSFPAHGIPNTLATSSWKIMNLLPTHTPIDLFMVSTFGISQTVNCLSNLTGCTGSEKALKPVDAASLIWCVVNNATMLFSSPRRWLLPYTACLVTKPTLGGFVVVLSR